MPHAPCPMPRHPAPSTQHSERSTQHSALRIERSESLEGPDPERVAVRPVRLDRVVADGIDREDLEGVGAVVLRKPTGHAPEQIGLSGAGGAGAGASELLERIV